MSADLLADPALPPFCDTFDAAVAASDAPALFTLDHHGRLRLDADRTRDALSRLTEIPCREPALYLLRDRATGWVQLVLSSAPALAEGQPRADATRYPDASSALLALGALGPLPVSRDPLGAGPSGGDVG